MLLPLLLLFNTVEIIYHNHKHVYYIFKGYMTRTAFYLKRVKNCKDICRNCKKNIYIETYNNVLVIDFRKICHCLRLNEFSASPTK